MQVVACPACGANNRPQATYCMRCGKPIPPADNAASRRARAFVERERGAPYFGAFPEALDFSPRSLAVMDTLISELWGEQGEAPGRTDWEPSPTRLHLITDLGAYLGEVLVRHLPARWQMHPEHPEAVLAARVLDAQGRPINPFAQMGVRFRDGAAVGMASLYTNLSGRLVPKWSIPRDAPAAPARAPAEVPAAPAPAPRAPEPVDVDALRRSAEASVERGHFGNAAIALRQVADARPGDRAARRELIEMLAQSGALEDALREVDEQRRLQPADAEWADVRAVVLAHLGRIDEALGTLDMALMKNPGETKLARRRAFVLLKGARWARAQAELAKLVAADEDAELRMGLAHALFEQGQAAAAREQLERVVSTPMRGRTPQIEAAARERLARKP